jgi:hypothetical protein
MPDTFGVAYRDVLFQKIAPGYDSIYEVPMRGSDPHDRKATPLMAARRLAVYR